ncbi:SIS domain-containing protein [Arthrobacter sp. 2RAF6]|uniref:SIS domain-containing protein n=1 Tax=Arthrobacter sp. 2RAF6 TaxID=3233002 RepID=UPI003F92B646
MTVQTVAVRPSPADLKETFDRILSFRPQLDAIAEDAIAKGLKNVFFVGAGGSYLAAFGAVFLLQSKTNRFETHHMTSAEFTSRNPAGLGSHSLVIAGSHTGGTKETLEAIELAKSAGATVIGWSYNPDSALALASPHFFAYESKTTAADAKQMIVAVVAWSLLKAAGYEANYDAVNATYENMATALLSVHEQVEDRFYEIGQRYHAEPVTYVLGAGPGTAGAYNLSMCYFQEMQWMHSAFWNTAEFFHGSMEIVDENTPFFVFLGEDSTRPIGERAVAFLSEYTKKLIVIDTKDLDLPGIPEDHRDLATSHVLLTISIRLANYYAHASGHDLSLRRYMGKVAY